MDKIINNANPLSGAINKKVPDKGFRVLAAFTLVELIVVITILAILATVGFVSFSGYLAGTRDVNRVSQLKSMSDALELYRTKKDLPTPDDFVEIKTNTRTIAYQGYIGKDVLETIEYTESGLDPKDKQYFSYYLTRNKKYFQLMALLEEPSEDVVARVNTRFTPTNAIDYTDRFPKTTGKKLGILTNINNTPIQELTVIIGSGSLNIETTTDNYIAIFKDENTLKGTGSILLGLEGVSKLGGNLTKAEGKNCKEIQDKYGKLIDGVYNIKPDGEEFQVYCDMTTDGGCWTLVMRGNGDTDIFNYDSIYWIENNTYNEKDIYNNNSSIKLNSYNLLSFNSILLGMNVNNKMKKLIINKDSTSFLELIKNGGKINTNLGRNKWLNLIDNILVLNNCNDEGFNINYGLLKTHIGIVMNGENDCSNPDSLIGFGNGGNHPWGKIFSFGGGIAGSNSAKSGIGWIYVR
ncbi:MAG: fibrinogen-like YCDxxxxGGGW domain-containing protein [Candidatus Gracilibacteria bacterium]|nr:fibrinogen-like YCDxxxxGGGW domain-containing protein [Candidatus Gracilibacteria bacterium]